MEKFELKELRRAISKFIPDAEYIINCITKANPGLNPIMTSLYKIFISEKEIDSLRERYKQILLSVSDLQHKEVVLNDKLFKQIKYMTVLKSKLEQSVIDYYQVYAQNRSK